MADLSALRAAKQALDEQLITQQDFDCVKVAFLRAQQIKAGLDAGFIKQDAYEKASNAYLHALDFQLLSSIPSMSAVPNSQPTPQAPVQQQAVPRSLSGIAAAETPPAAPPAPPAAAAAAQMAPPPARPTPGLGLRPVRNSSSSSVGAGLLGAAGNGDTQPNSPLSLQGSDEPGPEIPADLPDYCRGAARGKVGVGVCGLACATAIEEAQAGPTYGHYQATVCGPAFSPPQAAEEAQEHSGAAHTLFLGPHGTQLLQWCSEGACSSAHSARLVCPNP